MKRIIILFTIMLTGCGVTGREIKEGEKACEPHGGVSYQIPVINGYKVGCNDGVVITGNIRP